MTGPPGEPAVERRLDSWKEIAGYLKRGVTTVQRWERVEALPVHRLPHQKSGSIFAYRSELDEWWRQRSAGLESADPAADVACNERPRGPARPARTLGVLATLAVAAVAFGAWLVLPGRPIPPRRVILAVLPFENPGRPPGDDYLTDGVTAELIAVLGQAWPQGLGVVARASVMPYKGRTKPIREVGRELGAQYIVKGNLRLTGDHLHVDVLLSNARTEARLWAGSFEFDPRDLLQKEGEIAAAIAEALSLPFARAPDGRLPPGPAAHEAYLKGLYYWNKRGDDGVHRALGFFREAIRMEPAFARAHAGLAMAHASLATAAEVAPAREARDLAVANARRALELAPGEAEGHAALSAIFCRFDWNWRDCDLELRRSVELDPNYAAARHWLGEHLLQRGRLTEAQAELERARALDPLSPAIRTHVGLSHLYAGRFPEALTAFNQALEIDPHFRPARRVRGLALVRAGRVQEGLLALQDARAASPLSAHAAADLGYALGWAGRSDAARQTLRDLHELAKARPVTAYDFALVHTGLGERTLALEFLERAYAERATGLLWLKVETLFDGLRADPRFVDLVRRVGLPD